MDNKILYSNKWVFYYTKIDDAVGSIRVDLGAKELQSDYPKTICVRIYYEDKVEQGLPTKTEWQKLNTIEDQLTELLQGQDHVYQVGTITSNGHADYIYVVQDSSKYEELFNNLLAEQSEYKYFVQSFDDDKFAFYYNVLFPTEYDFNVIYTRQICQNLEKQGDAFTTPRTIDYFTYFKTEKQADAFVAKISDLYTNVQKNYTELSEWEVVFHNDLIPTIDTMLQQTAEVFQLVKQQDGVFDGWGCTVEKA